MIWDSRRDASCMICISIIAFHFEIFKYASNYTILVETRPCYVDQCPTQHMTPTRKESQWKSVSHIWIQIFFNTSSRPDFFIDLEKEPSIESVTKTTLSKQRYSWILRIWLKFKCSGCVTSVKTNLNNGTFLICSISCLIKLQMLVFL